MTALRSVSTDQEAQKLTGINWIVPVQVLYPAGIPRDYRDRLLNDYEQATLGAVDAICELNCALLVELVLMICPQMTSLVRPKAMQRAALVSSVCKLRNVSSHLS